MKSHFEKAIAVCDRATETHCLSRAKKRLDFNDTFTPEVVHEMLELLYLSDECDEPVDADRYDALIRKIGGDK